MQMSETNETEGLADLGWDPAFAVHLAEYRTLGCVPGRIAREEKHLYLACCAQGDLLAEVSGKFHNRASRPGDYPKLGDWVALAPRWPEGRAVIHGLLPRRNVLSRKEPGINVEEQILAANVDMVFVVTGLDRDFNVRRIERYLALILERGIEAVIVLNKADLCPDLSARVAVVEGVAMGSPVHAISALLDQGVGTLLPYFRPGRTVAFLGSSGAGKSTIINRFLGETRQAVNTLRFDGRGRHTTVKRELIRLPGGGLVIDSPGLREIQLWAGADDIGLAFGEIEKLSVNCRFRDCLHEDEPGCAVRAGLARGEVDRSRYANFQKLQKEARRLEKKKAVKERRLVKSQARKTSRKAGDDAEERHPRRW